MEDLVTRLVDLLMRYGYLAIFVIMMVEEAGVPSPIPGDGLLLFAGYLISRGDLSFLACLATVDAGALIGATILYWLARRGGRRAVQRYGRWVHLSEKRLSDLERFFARLGRFGPGIARLIPGLRIYTSALAGLAVVPFGIFLVNVAWACTLWAAGFLWLGYYVGARWRDYTHASQQATLYGGVAILMIGGAYLVSRRFLRKRWASRGRDNTMQGEQSVPDQRDESEVKESSKS